MYSWNKCFIIYRTNTTNVAACRNTSQVLKLKMLLLQYFKGFYSGGDLTRHENYVVRLNEVVAQHKNCSLI